MPAGASKKATILLVAALGTALAGWLALRGLRPGDRRSVLIVSIDTLRADHLSSYGYGRVTSPNLDRLAAEGALFEEHVSSTSWTLPAHAALFTAMPDSVHRCTDTDTRLPEQAETLAERFRASGWRTAGFFSGPYLHPAFGLAQGFEHYEDCTGYAERTAGDPDDWAMEVDVMRVSHEDVTSPRLVAALDRWLDARRDGPFFAFVHMWDPHFDFVPPPPWDTKFDPDYEGTIDGRRFFVGDDHERYHAAMDPRDLEHVIALYDGEIGWTDDHVGKILDGLERRGLLENTIVCVTSDHGTEFFEHGGKGHRRTLFDEVVRVPLILRWPAGVPSGVRMQAQSRSIDVAPTLLDLADLPLFPATYGMSLVPRFGGEPAQPPHAVSELFSVGQSLRALRSRTWKFYEELDRVERYWFDLEADPGEKRRFVDTSAEPYVAHEHDYEQELDRMNRHRSRWPLPTVRPEALPSEVLEALHGYGYVGEDEADAPEKKD